MRTHLIISMLLIVFLADDAFARQYLIRDGNDWEYAAQDLRPGDEVIFMRGEHQPGTLENVRGTAERPILLRGVDPKQPSTIKADRYGIRLIGARHVRIADLVINGASINGIDVEGALDQDEPDGDLTIERVTINDTGPRGTRPAINVMHMQGVNIRDCTIAGWGGSGIEVIGGGDVTVERTTLTGKEAFEQISGIRMRAGCRGIVIRDCTLERAGEQAICLGAQSAVTDFIPELLADASTATLFEARDAEVTQCLIRNTPCAFALVNAHNVILRKCTVIRPRHSVISVRQDQTDSRFGPVSDCRLADNLITWEPGDLSMITHLGEGATTAGISLEQNLWWSSDWQKSSERLGPLPGSIVFPQVTDVDPRLDEQGVPHDPEAKLFGTRAP